MTSTLSLGLDAYAEEMVGVGGRDLVKVLGIVGLYVVSIQISGKKKDIVTEEWSIMGPRDLWHRVRPSARRGI